VEYTLFFQSHNSVDMTKYNSNSVIRDLVILPRGMFETSHTSNRAVRDKVTVLLTVLSEQLFVWLCSPRRSRPSKIVVSARFCCISLARDSDLAVDRNLVILFFLNVYWSLRKLLHLAIAVTTYAVCRFRTFIYIYSSSSSNLCTALGSSIFVDDTVLCL
jgi:hypothetical protein